MAIGSGWTSSCDMALLATCVTLQISVPLCEALGLSVSSLLAETTHWLRVAAVLWHCIDRRLLPFSCTSHLLHLSGHFHVINIIVVHVFSISLRPALQEPNYLLVLVTSSLSPVHSWAAHNAQLSHSSLAASSGADNWVLVSSLQLVCQFWWRQAFPILETLLDLCQIFIQVPVFLLLREQDCSSFRQFFWCVEMV